MIRIRVTPREGQGTPSLGAATLPAHPCFRVDIFAADTRLAGGALWLAWLATALFALGQYLTAQQRGEPYWPSLIGSFFLLLLAAALHLFARKIARVNVQMVALGQRLPTISPHTSLPPLETFRHAARKFWSGSSGVDPFEINLAVRQTEPNVSMRLAALAAAPPKSPLWLNSDVDAAWLVRFHEGCSPASRSLLHRAAESFQAHSQIKQDIWPLVRLTISRILYQRQPAQPQRRTLAEVEARPDHKGAHYYLAFKLNVLPLAYWLMLLVLAINLPQLGADPLQKPEAALAAGLLVLLWAICTMAYNRNVVSKWRLWLRDSGIRPLGFLPIFMHVQGNPPSWKWEEIDEQDFKVYLEAYFMDVAMTFSLVQGVFLGLAMSFVLWFR